jgi:hypothetical protein
LHQGHYLVKLLRRVPGQQVIGGNPQPIRLAGGDQPAGIAC